jgi:ADP-ribosylglycohydrolase
MANSLPADYIDRVYAGVLGKLIGVYLGRPFEGWSHQRIMKELGHVRHYVHHKLNLPLVVTDDDVSGTFVFARAIEEHGTAISAEDIGNTWLNNVVENRSIFWFGGYGISTEHTAYLNLKNGIPAPLSGSMKTNGQTIAEQIGAQIFIDGWAMIAPGAPALAAKLAEAAGSVSHDGESVYAAKIWAAMEAEAFVSKDVDHLLDVGLSFIPAESLIARVIQDVRSWVKLDDDWEKTRQRIEDVYGYDKFGGVCHVVPNHAVMIMSLLYGGHDFHKAMHIVNTSGWDTDCNSGNVGCLVAIMNGLAAFEEGPDWRGPLADRAIISSADGGYSINNAARITYDIVNSGRKLAGEPQLPTPKNSQFHFSLPGSVQGFGASLDHRIPGQVKVEQSMNGKSPALAIRLHAVTNADEAIEVLTHTFTKPDELTPLHVYELMASPLVYPGQKLRALVGADNINKVAVRAQLRLKVYGPNDSLISVDGPIATLEPGRQHLFEWVIPDNMDSQPIEEVGLALSVPEGRLDGTVWLDSLGWTGTPHLILRKPINSPGKSWIRAWVNDVTNIMPFKYSFYIAQNRGDGVFIYGTREWTNYKVIAHKFIVNIGGPCGVIARVQGLRRYYSLVFLPDNRVALVMTRDHVRKELASAQFDWKLDIPYEVALVVQGNTLKGNIVDGPELLANDDSYLEGGIGIVVHDGSASADQFDIIPLD